MEKSFKLNASDYQVIKKINEGGFGVVYAVRNKETKKEFAAKVLKKYSSDEDEDRQNINNEIKVLKRFNHPTIVRFYGISSRDFFNNKNYTLFFDLFNNGSLENILEQSRKGSVSSLYNNTAKQIILIGIARGMMLLHQNRIIHRDLKPGNILIDDEFRPHITDFGLSQSFETYEPVLTNSGDQGTPIYMAPEVIESENYTTKADVYSFGILLFEVLTNSEPYPNFGRGMTRYQFLHNIVSGELHLVFPKGVYVKQSLKSLVTRCIDRFCDRRPTFNEIFSMLAFGKDPILDDLDDDDVDKHRYFLDDIDIAMVNKYVDLVKDDNTKEEAASTKAVDELAKKVEKMNKQMDDLKEENRKLKEHMIPSQSKSTAHSTKSESESKESEMEKRFQQLEKQLREYQQRTNSVIDQMEDENRAKFNKLEDRFQILTASIESVTVPENVTEIPPEAFTGCKNLKKVTLSSSVISIGSGAFACCSNLTEINIPDSVVSIGKYAFNECSSLVRIKIPPSVKTIERAVFRNCKALKEVTISPNTKVETGAFCGCPLLKKKPGHK